MNKFLNTYLTYRKKSFIDVYSLCKTNEFKYYNLSDHNLNLSYYKLTSGYYDSKGHQGYWIGFLNDGNIRNLFMLKNNKIKLNYYFSLNNKIKKITHE